MSSWNNTCHSGKLYSLFFVVMALLVGVLISGAVVLYVAYPHRGRTMPVLPQVGEAMGRGVRALPVLED